jgi:hypothetical protein
MASYIDIVRCDRHFVNTECKMVLAITCSLSLAEHQTNRQILQSSLIDTSVNGLTLPPTRRHIFPMLCLSQRFYLSFLISEIREEG